jgi:hypothetical protein
MCVKPPFILSFFKKIISIMLDSLYINFFSYVYLIIFTNFFRRERPGAANRKRGTLLVPLISKIYAPVLLNIFVRIGLVRPLLF